MLNCIGGPDICGPYWTKAHQQQQQHQQHQHHQHQQQQPPPKPTIVTSFWQ